MKAKLKKPLTALMMAWGTYLAIPCPYKVWDDALRPWQIVCLPPVGLVVGGIWALCAGIFAACIVLPARAARTYGESAHTLREIGQFMRFLRNGLIQRRPVKELLEEMNCPSERVDRYRKVCVESMEREPEERLARLMKDAVPGLELTGKYEQAVLQELEYAARTLENGDAEIASEQLEAAYERLTELAEEADRCFEKKRELYRRTGLISAAAVCMLII